MRELVGRCLDYSKGMPARAWSGRYPRRAYNAMVHWFSAKTMTDEFAAGVVLSPALEAVHQGDPSPFTLGFHRDD